MHIDIKENRTVVCKNDIRKAVADLGITAGDTVIVHSSFKSMGYVDGGAEAVVQGYLDVLGEDVSLQYQDCAVRGKLDENYIPPLCRVCFY